MGESAMGKAIVMFIAVLYGGCAIFGVMFLGILPPGPTTLAMAALACGAGVKLRRQRHEAQNLRDARWFWWDKQRGYVPQYNLRLDRD